MIYIKVKLLHTIFAALSITGFMLRGYWMLRQTPLLHHRLTRTLPHVNDTLLLLAGVWLVFALSINPFAQPWLLAKFAGLLAYIVLGTIALKRGRTAGIRKSTLLAAIAVYAYVVGVAITKSPLSWPAIWLT
jgi:uncharacterized membrane protein SirB2